MFLRKGGGNKLDATARELIDAAKKMGALYQAQDGTLDGLLLYRGQVFVIDWKQPKGKRTEAQERLSQAGWPIHYISTPIQLERLLKGE